MKNNLKFFAIALSLLLASSLLLAGCMYTIAADNGEPKAYDRDCLSADISGPDPADLEAAPLPQKALQEKFNRYIHAEGNVVTVFSEQQYNELKAIREKGERVPLSYDEVLFLMNDSVNLYFRYEEIRLRNAAADGIGNQLVSGNAEIIYPYHGDFSEFAKYDAACEQYEKMLKDIYSIIYYRIYMHDAGFERVYEGSLCRLPKKDAESEGAYEETRWEKVVYTDEEPYDQMDSFFPEKTLQLLSFNNSAVSGCENKALLVGEWEKELAVQEQFSSDSVTTAETEPLTAPLLVAYHDLCNPWSYPFDQLYRFEVVVPETHETTTIYPTAELRELRPGAKEEVVSGDLYISGDKEGDWGPNFVLYQEVGEFQMSLSSFQSSFSATGQYKEQDGVLRLYPEIAGNGVQDIYSYVFHNEDGVWVYRKEQSNPPEGVAITDGLRFRLLEGNVYSSRSGKPIANMKDYTKEEGIYTDCALELFFEDEKYMYFFRTIRSTYVVVTFADGTAMTVEEALSKGYIGIHSLDVYGIDYYKKPKAYYKNSKA